jgi:hypothetical protein
MAGRHSIARRNVTTSSDPTTGRRLWAALTVVVLALAVTVGVNGSSPALAATGCSSTGSPTVTTDKPDYSPGDIVRISGTGYACGSTVTVRIVPPSKTVWTTTAAIGNDGVLSSTYQIPSSDSVGQYFLTVLNASGTVLASTVFTDTHFRYGVVSWTRPTLSSLTVTFTIQAAYRLGFFTTCLGSQPTVGTVIPANSSCNVGTLTFGDNQSAPFGLKVTSVDTTNDVMQGFGTLTHTYPSHGTFTADWNNCCRLTSAAMQNNNAGGGEAWNLQTTLNLDGTSGAVQSPSSQLPAITSCSVGAVCTVPIPVSDTDPNASAITYRLSTPAEMGGAYEAANGLPPETQPPGATIDPNSGVFTWNSAGHGGVNDLWNASVTIEARNAAGTIISTVEVDFLILQIAGVPPVFVSPPSPTSGSTFSTPVSTPLSLTLEATSTANFAVTIHTISTVTGATMSCPAAATPITCTYTWTPSLNDVGSHLVSFVAEDSTGKTSATLQITISVPPVQVNVTPNNQNDSYGDPDPAFTFQTTGFLGTDTFSTAPTCGVAGAHTDAGTYSITCSGGVAPFGYAIHYDTAQLTVARKTVTITPDNQSINYGDTPVFTYQVTGLVGTDDLTQQPTCGVGTANPGVGSYPITCSGATASGNYTLQYGTATLSVGAKTITVTPDNETVTYGTAPTFTYQVTGLVGTDDLTQQPTCGVGTANPGVGTYPITCSGATADANYTIDYDTATLTVTAKTITVTPDDKTITYGDADPAFTFQVSGLVGTETLSQQPTCAVTGPHADAGTYTITCSGATADANYTINYGTATFTVERKTVTVTADNQTNTYGLPDPAFTFHNTPFVGTDTFTTVPTCGVAGAHANVGTYPISCSGATASDNYTIEYATGALAVSPATIVITPDNQMKLPGAPDPAFTYHVTGLVGSDALLVNPTCGVSGPHDTPGTYPITCSGAIASSNYIVTYGLPGVLTVAKATPNISTIPSASVPVGGLLSDRALLTGGANPGGTVTFMLYAPSDPQCTSAIATRTGTVSAGTALSGTVQATQVGAYNWVAIYSGDAMNNVVVSPCGSERVIVTAQVLTGRAYGLAVSSSLLGLPLLTITPTPDTGPVSTIASSTTAPACLASVSGLTGVQAVCSSVSTVAGFGARSTATASVARATISIATIPAIVLQAVQSTSSTTCAGSTGSVTIAYLAVGTVVLISKPTPIAPNTKISVAGVSLVLNEQVPITTPDAGLTVNAVHVSVNVLGLARVNAVIASAESDIGNCP